MRMLPLAQALVRRGHAVAIIAPPVHNPQDAGRRNVYDGVPVAHTTLPTLPGALGSVQQVWLLLRPLLAQPPDVVHLFKPKGYSGLAALLLRWLAPHVPLVVDTDDWEGWGGWNDLLPYPTGAKHLFAWQERNLVRRADSVTVASRTLETQVWGNGIAPSRVFYLPNGVSDIGHAVAPVNPAKDEDKDTKGDEAVILLYTRFWEFDVRDVVAAWVAVVQQRAHARLLVVGKGEQGEEDVLMHVAQQAGVAASLTYRGWVEPAEIPALLAAADAALAPMDDTLINRARCSVKVLELMAAGLPIVAGRVGQLADYIVHEESGLLVAPGSPAALAQAIIHMLDNPDLRVRLGNEARTRAITLFGWDRLVVAAEHAYEYAQWNNRNATG